MAEAAAPGVHAAAPPPHRKSSPPTDASSATDPTVASAADAVTNQLTNVKLAEEGTVGTAAAPLRRPSAPQRLVRSEAKATASSKEHACGPNSAT